MLSRAAQDLRRRAVTRVRICWQTRGQAVRYVPMDIYQHLYRSHDEHCVHWDGCRWWDGRRNIGRICTAAKNVVRQVRSGFAQLPISDT